MRMLQLSLLVPMTGCIAIFLALSAGGHDQAPASDPSEGSEVLRRIREAYADCESYRDEGEVRTVFVSKDGLKRTDLKTFKTAFVRPDRFRFEFKARRGEVEWNQYVIWADEDGVRSWWTIEQEVEYPTSLGLAIAGATGVSSGSAYYVPNLLMPDLVGGRGLLPDGSKVIGEELLDGLACHKVEDPDGMTLWFDKEELLLRAVFQTRAFEDEGFSTEKRMTYRPQFNVEIADAELTFEPPSR